MTTLPVGLLNETQDGHASQWLHDCHKRHAAPGSATSKDDDYYFAGTFPDPIGALAIAEEDRNVERALTVSDPRQRFHFNLPTDATTSTARLTLKTPFDGPRLATR